MNRSLAIALVLVAASAAPARAEDTFETKVRSAVRVSGPEALAAVFWSQTTTCKNEDDFYRRQCEGIKESRRAKVASTTFVVEADGALEVEPYNEKARSVDVEVRACASCGGVDIGGQRRYLVGRGAVKVVGGKVKPVALRSATKTFATKAEGQTWMAEVAPRLTTELLVRVPAKIDTWKDGGAEGYRMEVVGFRVIDPCKGTVLWAQPKSGDVPPDPPSCEAAARDAGPSEEQVRSAMVAAEEAAQACAKAHKKAGKAIFVITFDADGKILELAQEGRFAGTPTGNCLDNAVRKATLPSSKRAKTTIRYPIVLVK